MSFAASHWDAIGAVRQFPALPKFERSGEIEMSLAFAWV